MLLILSSRVPWNTNYCNETGQILFKAEALGRKIKLSRVVPRSTAVGGGDREYSKSYEESSMRDVFQPVGEVEFHVFRNSHIKYKGGDQSVDKLFKKTGPFSIYGRNRVFMGPDGREYIWKMSSGGCKLFLNDSSETPVATFHSKHRGILGAQRSATLEIFPSGEHMITLIFITFIYMEKVLE